MMNAIQGGIRRGNFTQLSPEFGRVTDIQTLFGVKKGILYRWIGEGRIKSICIRDRGNVKGIRLISVDSVRAYIKSQMDADVALPV